MNAELRPEWTKHHPTPIEAIDPRLLEWDNNNRARINPDLNKGSGGDGKCQGTQSHADREELFTMPQPNSEHYTNSMTDEILMNTGEEPQRSPSPSVNSSEAQKDNLLEDRIFQTFLHTARATPQSPSPVVEIAPQSSNTKRDDPLTLDHPVTEGYLELVPHLQYIIEHIINATWYKESRQEPPGEDLPVELGLKTRQSSSTPMSVFGEFFSARQPYDCLLCPKDSPKHKHKRTLERALGHSREHFNFKPIQANRETYTHPNMPNQANRKTYTNLNTKNDQERRALNPAKFCIPCAKRITRQNWKRHAESKAHATSATGYPEDQKIWENSQ